MLDGRSQIMVDIETLSTAINCAIVSIGAIKFSLSEGIQDRFKVNIDPVSCKKFGRAINKKTIDWWFEQPKAAREGWMTDPKPMDEALNTFADWYGPKSRVIWSKGSYFDFPRLEDSFQACEIAIPWKYWDVYDYRTIINVLKIDDRKLKSEGSVYHDAVSDCEEQLKVLLPLLKALTGG